MVSLVLVRQDSPLGVAPLDITGYHPPWKQLTEFAIRPDSDHPSPQHFNSLVNQVKKHLHKLVNRQLFEETQTDKCEELCNVDMFCTKCPKKLATFALVMTFSV